MATLRKQEEKWVLDYTLHGRRRRLWFKDKVGATQALKSVQCQELRQKLHGVDGSFLEVEIALAIENFLSGRVDNASYGNEPAYMTRFYEFMCEKPYRLRSVSQIQLKHLNELKDAWLSQAEPATVVRGFAIYKVFIKECIKRKWIREDPLVGFSGPRVRAKMRRIWTEDEIRLVHKHMPSWSQDVFAFLALTGVRPVEAVTLKRSDVLDKAVRVHCFKNRSDGTRVIGLSDEAWNLVRKRIAFNSGQWVFGDPLGRQINPAHLNKTFTRVRRELGINGNLVLYALRHTFASKLVNENVNLKVVQELLGHSQIRTTEKYLTVNTETLSKAANINKLGL